MMNRIRKTKNKEDICFIIYMLILVAIRAFLAVKTGYAIMCSDEVCHWGLSRSIYAEGKTLIRGIPADIFSCLYSISIAWVHFFADYEVQYTVAHIANAIYMVSMLIPFYLLAQKVLGDKKKALIVTIIAGLLPEFAYNAHILQENLFFPIVMWTFYYIYIAYEKEALSVKDAIIIGVLSFLCFWTRRAGICIAMAIVGSMGWNMLFEKRFKQYFKSIAIFGLSFVLIYLSVSQVYHYLNPDAEGISASAEILARIDINLIFDWFHGGLRYLVIFLLITGFFSWLFPFLILKKMNKVDQRFVVFVTIVLFCAIVESVGMIYVNENMERIHIRYLSYIIPIILLYFIKSFYVLRDKGETLGRLQRVVIVCYSIFGMAVMVIFDCFCLKGSSIDGNSNRFLIKNNLILSQWFDMENYESIVKILLIVFIIFNMILLLRGKYNKVVIMICSFFCIIQILNNYLCYEEERQLKQDFTYALEEDATMINEYINTCVDQKAKIALVTENNTGNALELHVTKYPLYNISHEQYMRDLKEDDGTLPNNEIKYYGFGNSVDGTLPDYIIIAKELQDKNEILSYEEVLETPNYKVMKQADEIFRVDVPLFDYTVTGMSGDGWIMNDVVDVSISAKQEINMIVFQFNYLGGAVLGIKGSAGVEKFYDLAECDGRVEYLPETENTGEIKLKLYGVQTVKPSDIGMGSPDHRNLCAQLLDISIVTNE